MIGINTNERDVEAVWQEARSNERKRNEQIHAQRLLQDAERCESVGDVFRLYAQRPVHEYRASHSTSQSFDTIRRANRLIDAPQFVRCLSDYGVVPVVMARPEAVELYHTLCGTQW